MRKILLFALFLPVVASGQMMPERLARTDSVVTMSPKRQSPTKTVTEQASSVLKDTGTISSGGEIVSPPTSKQVPAREGPDPMSSFEFWLSVMVLGFTLIMMIGQVWLIRSKLLNPDMSYRGVLVTIIIGATLFLITAGYSNDQIAPAMGLFGTIAGYLLGRTTASKEKEG
ncbi:MAG: hypothetical protein KF749_17710 [Bacteroidetes bacterium]|nr:hypothetical protein [Bacteroidota bacterium]MCW5896340.1 hypothetical protein [Bacteroidota bacterium]